MKANWESTVRDLAAERQGLLKDASRTLHGLAWCRRHADLVDRAIRAVVTTYDLSSVAFVATGGYGRRELAPASDADLTVIPSVNLDPQEDDRLRRCYMDLTEALQTVLGVTLSYEFRLIADAPALDLRSRTGLMDGRLVCGDDSRWQELQSALELSFAPAEFILEKIAERQAAFEKFNDTPEATVPQLRDGAGGLRCFQTANWLRAAVGDQPKRPGSAFDRVLALRVNLHALAGKPQDLLTRSRQHEIATLRGVSPAELIQECLADLGTIHAEYLGAVQNVRESRFPLTSRVHAVRGQVQLDGAVDAADAAVGIALGTALGLRMPSYRMAVRESRHGATALFALSRGEPTLRNLDRSGVLGNLLPELEACRHLVRDDGVHEYSVYEHTFRVVRAIDGMESGTFLGDVKDSIPDRAPLYLAALLHDVGKRIDVPRHAEIGEQMARKVAERLQLEASLAESVAWLVRNHLVMARFLRLRDLNDAATYEEFAALVKDPVHLALLTVLTAADIQAVSANTYTPAQDSFLRVLYEGTLEVLSASGGGVQWQRDTAEDRRLLLRQLTRRTEDPEAIRAFVNSLPAYYIGTTKAEVVRLHFEYVRRAESGQVTIDITPRLDLSGSEITVCAPDAPGLLSRILGVIYAFDISLIGIRACTTDAPIPVALDTFTVQFSGRPVPLATAHELEGALQAVARGEQATDEILRARGKQPEREQRIFTYSYTPGTAPGVPGRLEIRAPRGRGMPFRFSRLITQMGWNIAAARVSQVGGSGAAAFFITTPAGDAPTALEVEAAVRPLEPDP